MALLHMMVQVLIHEHSEPLADFANARRYMYFRFFLLSVIFYVPAMLLNKLLVEFDLNLMMPK